MRLPRSFRSRREILAEEYGTQAEVVHNGVDVARFAAVDPALAAALRKRAGAESRPLILSVGGIEPRKGSDTLMKAVAELRKGARGDASAAEHQAIYARGR